MGAAPVRVSSDVPDDTPSFPPGTEPPGGRRRTPRSPLILRTDTTFPPLPGSPGAARQWCVDVFREWSIAADVSAILVICEDLVQFALGSGRGEIRVQLSAGPLRITISVTRRGLWAGEHLADRAGASLPRVASVATNWGVRENGPGNGTVWAEVTVA